MYTPSFGAPASTFVSKTKHEAPKLGVSPSATNSFDPFIHALGSKALVLVSPGSRSRALLSSDCNRDPRKEPWSMHTAGDASSTSNSLVHVLAKRANDSTKFIAYNDASVRSLC